MADRIENESFEDTRSATSTTSDAFRAEAFSSLASGALRHGFDFSGMVKDAGSAAFGSGSFALTDGEDVLTAGRIGEPPSAGKVFKDGLRVLKDGLGVAKDGIDVVRDGITVLQDVMKEAERSYPAGFPGGEFPSPDEGFPDETTPAPDFTGF